MEYSNTSWRIRRRSTLLCALALWIGIGLVRAAFAQERVSPVEVKLVPSVASVKPGESFLVGYLFSIKSPWHIYWRYPGEAGLPTRVKLELPPSLSASQLHWPYPTQFMQPGDILGYGYESEAFIWHEVQVSSDASIGAEVPIRADVRWLGCADLCVPGKAQLTASIPISNVTRPANGTLFAEWTKKEEHVPLCPLQ